MGSILLSGIVASGMYNSLPSALARLLFTFSPLMIQQTRTAYPVHYPHHCDGVC